MKISDKGVLSVCYFGTYSMEEGYPRNRVIIDGLRKNGVDVIECHEDFWEDTSQKLESVKGVCGMLRALHRLLTVYWKLIKKFRRIKFYDVLIVGYAGHIDIFMAKLLNLFRRRPLIFDAFLSLYDTAVMDRQIVRPRSFKAKLLWLIDTWSCRLADAVLLDTQAHIDYFVSEFGLPSGKFYAVPVGSSLPANSSRSVPVKRNEICNILYFGSYITLHGVDTILRAAKLIQDRENANDDENPACHPELVSGSQMMQGQEIPKQVRDDRGVVFSSERKVIFTLAGKGQLLPEMKKLAANLGLRNVFFKDKFMKEKELAETIHSADICLGIFGQTEKAMRVIPCKVYNCLSAGKPVITAKTQATEGVLTHGENAYLCRPGDPEDLAIGILKLKNDVSLCNKIACHGAEYYRNNFSTEAIGKRVHEIIRSVCRKKELVR